ncbi:CdaR family protein [Sediminibacillus massiliensis]|uniref:CdaR family protein n=1 Tax=Sediminibacillus massiliensis TaxID=1926277 RepID=UPI0009883493|nr:CdaR family protein [Sediminibacillus massiliensis]
MDDWLNRPWVISLISLALAILLFTAVTLDENTYQPNARLDTNNSADEAQRVEDVPVNIKIDEEEYVVSGVPQSAAMVLEGANSVVTSTVTQQPYELFVDLEGYEPGTHTVDIEYSGIPKELDVHVDPQEVEVTIEERATEEFNVSVDYINSSQIADGFEVGDATVEPSTVQITSSRNVVDQIAVVKAFVDLKDVEESIDAREVPVKVYDSQGNELNARVEPETVQVGVDIRSPNKEVPIEVATTGELPDDVSVKSIVVEPGNVNVFASEEMLEDISNIQTEEVNLSNIDEGTAMEVSLDPPEGARLLDPEQVKVTIELERTETSTFENLPIEVENLSDGLTLNFLEPEQGEIDLTVFGTEEELSNLSEDDFRLAIDAEELEEGEHTLPISVEGPEGINTDLGSEEATVEID